MTQFFIGAYRVFLSPLLHQSLVWPGGCRFHPTCSDYGQEAIRQYGLLTGFVFIFRRLGHCHPWAAGGFDPLPPRPVRSKTLDPVTAISNGAKASAIPPKAERTSNGAKKPGR